MFLLFGTVGSARLNWVSFEEKDLQCSTETQQIQIIHFSIAILHSCASEGSMGKMALHQNILYCLVALWEQGTDSSIETFRLQTSDTSTNWRFLYLILTVFLWTHWNWQFESAEQLLASNAWPYKYIYVYDFHFDWFKLSGGNVAVEVFPTSNQLSLFTAFLCHFHFTMWRTDGPCGRASRVESIFRSSRLDFLSKLKPNHVPLRNEHVRNSTNELSSALHKIFFLYAVFAAVVCFVFCVCVCLRALRTIYSILTFFKFYIEIKINKESTIRSRKKKEHYVVCASRKPWEKIWENRSVCTAVGW